MCGHTNVKYQLANDLNSENASEFFYQISENE